jgi:hypothetical protein
MIKQVYIIPFIGISGFVRCNGSVTPVTVKRG